MWAHPWMFPRKAQPEGWVLSWYYWTAFPRPHGLNQSNKIRHEGSRDGILELSEGWRWSGVMDSILKFPMKTHQNAQIWTPMLFQKKYYDIHKNEIHLKCEIYLILVFIKNIFEMYLMSNNSSKMRKSNSCEMYLILVFIKASNFSFLWDISRKKWVSDRPASFQIFHRNLFENKAKRIPEAFWKPKNDRKRKKSFGIKWNLEL